MSMSFSSLQQKNLNVMILVLTSQILYFWHCLIEVSKMQISYRTDNNLLMFSEERVEKEMLEIS